MKPRAALLTVIICFYVTGCQAGDESSTRANTHRIEIVDLKDVITQTGEVGPVVKVDIQSEASGRIEKIYVKEGQKVSKGQRILDIDPMRLLYQRDRLELAVKRALIEKNLARRKWVEAQELSKTGIVSEENVLDLKSNYDLADINWNQQLLELKDIKDQLSKTTIESPMDGIITSLDVEEGEIAVSATSSFQSGTAIATVADISRLEVVSQIGEVDYVHLKQGGQVVIRPEALRKVSTTGTISFIAMSAKKQEDEELGRFEVRIDVDKVIPGIVPGINVNVDFVIMEKKGVVGVPNDFVKETPEGFLVEKRIDADSDTTQWVQVELGPTDYRHYEVTSGLKPGDVVVFREEDVEDEAEDGKGFRARKKHR